MQITREDLNPCTVALGVACDTTQVAEGYERAFKLLSKKVRLPGFRPGHAPKTVLAKMIDQPSLDEEAAEIIIKDSFRHVIESEKLEPEPTIRPSVELKAINQAEGKCEYTLTVSLPPVVELGEYVGLPVIDRPIEVTEAEIDYQIEELRKRGATREEVTDRGVVEGDVCVVNIKKSGDDGSGRSFMSVVGQTFPQLDEALLGMGAEEMKNLTLKFPKTFQDKDWADTEMECQITVNSITSTKPRDIEDLLKSTRAESIEELRTRFRELLERVKTQSTREIMTEELLDALAKQSRVDAPQAMWESLAERRLAETAEEQQRAGKTLAQYAEDNGMTLEQLNQVWLEKAKLHVERALLIREVFRKQDMKLDEQALVQELEEMSREYGTDPATLLSALKKSESMEEIHFRAISRRVSDFLIENADKKEPVGAKA